MNILPIETEFGIFTAGYTEKGLAQIDFPSRKKISATAVSPQIQRWHKSTSRALQNVLAGKNTGELPPLDLSRGTEFQQKIWSALREIKAGNVVTYAELAGKLGKPKGARAAGGACGANPIPVLIPCHRVLAASGKIGGFSGGLDWKKRLLTIERVKFKA
jgi:O-6-methylguanine DNA methyltransferase